MSTPVAFIVVCTIFFGPFFLIDYKHWRNARAAEKIFNEAKPKFIQECKRLGIRADLQFCDLYTASFIRCDHATERIAVYAGKTNRFAIIPYKDYAWIWEGPTISGSNSSSNNHYVTTQIGGTSVTTEYKAQNICYITGYRPTIKVRDASAVSVTHTGYCFDGTDVIGYRRFQQTKKFCEKVDKEMKAIGHYSYQVPYSRRKKDGSRMNFLEWKVEDEKFQARRANESDKYGARALT